MSQKQLAAPTTMQAASKVRRVQQTAYAGMNEDDPSSSIGQNQVVKLYNLLAYGDYAQGRAGNEEISSITLPVVTLPDDTTVGTAVIVDASKSGTTVTVGTGLLDNVVVGDYLLWETDGLMDQITSISGDTFTSLYSETRALESDCRFIYEPFGSFYHDKSKKIYIHMGTDLYQIDTADFAAYSKVPYIGTDGEGLTRKPSRFRPMDDDVVIFNDNGLFRIVSPDPNIDNKNINHYFQVNTDNPQRALDEIIETPALTYGRQVTYSFSRIVGGDYNAGRLGTGNILLQETSPVSPEESTRRDTAEVFTTLPVGIGTEANYSLTSKDTAVHITDNVTLWEALKGTAAFKMKISGKTEDIGPDFTDVETMYDVANRIQLALRLKFPFATCIFYKSGSGYPVLEITPGAEETIEAVTASNYVGTPDGGVDITTTGSTDFLYMNAGDGVLTTPQARKPNTYEAIKCEADSTPHTHATLWETVDIGAEGVQGGNLTDKLIWSKDVPLIRPVNCYWDNDVGAMFNGTFYQEDVGSQFTFWDGEQGVISFLQASMGGDESFGDTEVHAQATTTPASDHVGPMAFGAQKCGLASQSGNIVTLDPAYATLYQFQASDVGKIIFVENGELRHITNILYNTGLAIYDKAIVVETGDFTAQAIGWDYIIDTDTRSVRSNITDKILNQRGRDDDFILQTRYYIPLPSYHVGEMGNSFMFVTEENSTFLYYSAVPLGKKNRLGYYHPAHQRDDNTEDVITYIKRYADRIVCFCRRSTYGTSLSVINSLDEPTIGEKIFLIPHLSIVDNIGLIHTGSIQDIGIGQSIMVTHEPAVRSFDGRQYGQQNLSDDAVMRHINNMSTTCFSSYDNEGGYRLYGTLLEITLVSEDVNPTYIANLINPVSGFCLQFSVKPNQGAGWTIQGGPKMVMPMPFTEGLLIQNQKGYLIIAVLDELTGKWFNTTPYDGPAGSGLTKLFTDKDDTEILPDIILREDVGNPESDQLEFLAAHIYLRPEETLADAGQTPAYRDALTVACRIYNDGSIVYTAQTLDIPNPGDVSFDRKSQGPRIQTEFILGASKVQIMGIDRIYMARDRAGNQSLSSRETSEMTYQREYAEQLLWLSRGRRPTINRSIGNAATGDIPTRVEGPDGIPDSGMEFTGAADPLFLPIYQTLTGDMTIQLGYKK